VGRTGGTKKKSRTNSWLGWGDLNYFCHATGIFLHFIITCFTTAVATTGISIFVLRQPLLLRDPLLRDILFVAYHLLSLWLEIPSSRPDRRACKEALLRGLGSTPFVILDECHNIKPASVPGLLSSQEMKWILPGIFGKNFASMYVDGIVDMNRKLSLESNGLLQKCSRGRLAVKFMKTKSTTLQSENTDVVVVRTSYEYS
jgi:hypothetical protein